MTAEVSRRLVLQAGAAGIGSAMVFSSGCTTQSTNVPENSRQATENVLPTKSSQWPVDYDHPGSPDGVLAPFLYRYPTNPPRTVSRPPGRGSTITAACQLNSPVPAAMGRNPAWQAINTALNSTLDIQFTGGADWPAKLQTLLAGGDLPDLLQVTKIPRLPDLLPRVFADLTEYLRGDAVAEYPNLALLGDAAWRNVIHNGQICGVPQPRNRAGGAPFRVRADILEQLGIQAEPRDARELADLMSAVTDARVSRWASAGVKNTVVAYATMLNAPNGWEVIDGKLVSEYESAQLKQAINEVARLWARGVLHPDSFSAKNTMSYFDSGQTVMEYGAFDPVVRGAMKLSSAPNYRAGFIVLPQFSGGGVAAGRLDSGYYGLTAIRKGLAAERVKELLGVLNWIAAPVGTAEFQLRQYGVEGRHYTIKDGILDSTSRAASEVVILGYLACARPAYFPPKAGLDKIYDQMHNSLATQYKKSKDNPTYGLYSKTADTAPQWQQKFDDLQSEIIQGRKKLGDWDELLAEWRTAVGDKIRGEYEEALDN